MKKYAILIIFLAFQVLFLFGCKKPKEMDKHSSLEAETTEEASKKEESTKNEEIKTPEETKTEDTSTKDEVITEEETKTEEEKEPEIPSNEDYQQYDKFYPTSPIDTPYLLTVPQLHGRFNLSEDQKTATLFAPGVSLTSGYYDVNKNFYNDNHLCWAAACSNMLAWYLNQYLLIDPNISVYERDVNKIFDEFRKNWDYMEGYDYAQGFSWYFSGSFSTGTPPDELLNKNSGGYLKSLPNVGDFWTNLDPVNHYGIIGDYTLQFPFIQDNLRIDETHLKFFENILKMLHYGPCAIMILGRGTTATGGHAVTLWGAEFNVETGLISKIYLTDSDDEATHPGTVLREIKIKTSTDDYHGIEMLNYYPSRGNPSPFVFISGACNLFSPTVVSKK